MKILYYDCPAGISGDMNLAAMLDLGVPLSWLSAELSKLGLDDEFELRASRDARGGIHGTRVDVMLKGTQGHTHPADAHHHGHAHLEHVHDHEQPHQHAPSRNLADIERIIAGSDLPDPVRQTSIAIFRRLAEAEARVHGTTVEQIHFHEVGATDAIVDIVGAALCRHYLNVDDIWASAVELGGGFVRCAHGQIPVPAPATVQLLHGVPTTRGAVQKETTTPTGAAILVQTVSRFAPHATMIMERTGYGIGHREMDIPNVLRVHLAQVEEPRGRVEQARLLQCNIDDMTAEMLGVAMETLMVHGAMDVHFTPIQMKKNRPATSLSLLCSAQDEERFKGLIFRHTSTLGIKSFPLEKTVLDIGFETLETPLGPVSMKNAMQNGQVLRSKPELEDCKRLARQHGLTLAEVYACVGKHRKE